MSLDILLKWSLHLQKLRYIKNNGGMIADRNKRRKVSSLEWILNDFVFSSHIQDCQNKKGIKSVFD